MRSKTQTVLRDVEVLDYASEGKALAKVDGKVIFIPGAVPGDVVHIRLLRSRKDWAEAQLLELVKPSEKRVEPFCRHFGTCGGCKWQMVPYDEQLAFKQREVAEHLRRIGKVEMPEMEPILGAAKTRFYRNKLEYTFSSRKYLTDAEFREKGRSGEPALGFHVSKWFDKVIDISECFLQENPSNDIRNRVREIALEQGFDFYDIRAHEGFLRNLVIRYANTGELMVNLVVGLEDRDSIQLLFRELMAGFPTITTLLYTVNVKVNDSIHDLEPVTWHGKGFIIEEMEGFRFKIGPKSFFQTNTEQGIALYRLVREFAGLTGNEILYDLYCGTGSIGIFCSAGARKMIGVEVIGEAVEDARENAGMNGIGHARFFQGDVSDVCTPGFFAEHGRPDVVITDPPRAGMHERLVRTLLEISAPTLVYVSCNPATQARDLQLLDEKYRVTRIRPVDMFPHTHHIENVVQLKLR